MMRRLVMAHNIFIFVVCAWHESFSCIFIIYHFKKNQSVLYMCQEYEKKKIKKYFKKIIVYAEKK